LQASGQCFCGHKYGIQSYEQRPDKECLGECGSYIGYCGQGWRNAVYLTDYFPAKPDGYQGCYEDHAEYRDLPVSKGSGDNPTSCRAKCRGYTYFSLQAGQCFCGNSYGTRASVGIMNPKRDDTECFGECGSYHGYCGQELLGAVYLTDWPPIQKASADGNIAIEIGAGKSSHSLSLVFFALFLLAVILVSSYLLFAKVYKLPRNESVVEVTDPSVELLSAGNGSYEAPPPVLSVLNGSKEQL